MEISKGVVSVAAALCVAAGAGGAYLATRGGDPPPTRAAAEAGSAAARIGAEPAAATVAEQSKAIVDDIVAPRRAPAQAQSVADRREAQRVASRRDRAAQTTRPTRPLDPVQAAPVSVLLEELRVLPPRALESALAVDPEPAGAPTPPAPEFPPVPEFEELVVAADSVVGLQVETSVTSEQARVEDHVVARVTRDVRAGDRVAIPAESTAHGEVTLVDRGGRLRDRARLGIRFTSVVLADGTRIPLETETIYREGRAPGGESAARIGGGAIGGAIIGGIFGGSKGAAIGGAAGAGAGSSAVLAGGRNPATLPSGTPVTVRIVRPVFITVEK